MTARLKFPEAKTDRDKGEMEWHNYVTLVIIQVSLTALAAFFGSYLREKGKGLAIQESLDNVTKVVEEIKHSLSKDYFAYTLRTTRKFDALQEINKRLQQMMKDVVGVVPLGPNRGMGRKRRIFARLLWACRR